MPGDEELVVGVADGDEESLRELLRRYQRPLASFLHRHTGGPDVEDLYQETWLRVVKHARSFDASKRFSTWLFQIAINLCRDRHRRRPTPAEIPPAETASVYGASRVEAALDAAALLGRLPEAQREVVILRYYHDLTEQETAAVLACPVGTVKSRMHQALASMNAMRKAER